MSLFGIDIAGQVASALAGQLKDLKLHRETETDYIPEEDQAIVSTQTFTCEGLVLNYSEEMVARGTVNMNDRKVLIIAGTLNTEPVPGDVIEAEGKKYTLTGVPERDPAGATWTVRGVV